MQFDKNDLADYEKLTVLIFDEVKVCNTIEYDTLQDEVLGPHSQMQIVKVRGIASLWKQPVYVDFNQKNNKRDFIWHYRKAWSNSIQSCMLC